MAVSKVKPSSSHVLCVTWTGVLWAQGCDPPCADSDTMWVVFGYDPGFRAIERLAGS